MTAPTDDRTGQPAGPWVASEFLLAWNRGEFGEVSEGGSQGERWLESEMANIYTGRDKLDAERAREEPRRTSKKNRYCRTICPACNEELPLTRVCNQCGVAYPKKGGRR